MKLDLGAVLSLELLIKGRHRHRFVAGAAERFAIVAGEPTEVTPDV